ncbi:MAG: M48 family metallopeptidase, partial [Gammaproteobacteria bacterium]|nr:M48 family metallopeptidase [Gammaproteobacteria bacterium]
MVKRLLNALLFPPIKIGSTGPSERTKLHLPEHPDTPIELKRTQRKKTIAFRVANNCIKVMAPKRLALYRIQQLLNKRSEWIGRQLEYQASLPEDPVYSTPQYFDGAQIKYLGKKYHLALSHTPKTKQGIKFHSGRLRVNLPIKRQSHEAIKNLLSSWYQQRAEERLPTLVEQLSKKIGVSYGDIQIRHFKSRWGSCRADGRLQFNWRLMMAPSSIIEYVVVHELCHRLHLNHSPKFWHEVEKQMPDYRQHRKWL